jgi:hypothetical protein
MHPIKTRFLRIQIIALGLIAATSLLAQPLPPNPPKDVNGRDSQPKAGFSEATTLRGGESRELANARFELERLLADVGEQHPQVPPLRAKIAMLEKLEPKKISIDFPGGSIGKLVNAISANSGVSFSIVNAGDPADFATELPAFALRNATLRTVAAIVRNLLLPRGFELEPMDAEPNSVICTLRRNGPPKLAGSLRAEFESFQLAPFLAQQSVEDIIAAIRTAWELDPTHDREALRLKFHPPTSILLVSGPQEGIWLTRNILNQLKQPPGKPAYPDSNKPKGPPPPENDKR